ncbi:MAG: hypothetical protein CMA64_00405 [Euryarchaeota archaeon]|jgi:hypothetical protein|nr:hypothetical protein [Euryarchaeota archaeon]
MKYIIFGLNHILVLLFLTMPFVFLMACGVIVPVSQYKTVTIVKGGTDAILVSNDKQTTTDKAVSVITGKDCKLSRTFMEKDATLYCTELPVAQLD